MDSACSRKGKTKAASIATAAERLAVYTAAARTAIATIVRRKASIGIRVHEHWA